jgi:hypothetical protein
LLTEAIHISVLSLVSQSLIVNYPEPGEKESDALFFVGGSGKLSMKFASFEKCVDDGDAVVFVVFLAWSVTLIGGWA